MVNERILLIGGVGLVRGRVRDAGPVMVEICNELEPLLRESGYSDSAPFKTVSLILRFGAQSKLDPEYGALDRRHSELPVSVELEMGKLRRMGREDVKREFLLATLSVLVDVAQRYGLPQDGLPDRLARLRENTESS